MMKRYLPILIFLFVCRATIQAAPVSGQKPDSTIVLKEGVVITAQRMETDGDAVAEAVSTQTRDEMIRLSPMTTPDALAAMPGVWMQKTNHGGGAPYIRGLTGYQTLLLMDGIRFNNSTFRSGPNQYLNTVDPFTLQRVEVLRGQGSVQYGSDGIGGVAQLFFREPEFSVDGRTDVTGRIFGQYMNYDMEYAGRAEVEVGTSNFAILGGITYKSLGDIRAGGDLGTLKETGYDEHSWDIKAKAKIGNAKLTAAWQRLVQEEVPLYHQLVSGNYARFHFNPQQRDIAYVRLESSYQSKIFSQVRYSAAYLNSLEEREKQRPNSPVTRFERDNVDTYHGAVEILSDLSPRWKASSGVEYYYDRIASSARDEDEIIEQSNDVRGLYPDGTKYMNAAIFSMHSFDLDRFSLSIGARYNILQLKVDDPVFGETTVKPEALVGNMGIVYKASKNIQILANANTGFRAPNVNDVASFGVADYRYEVPNYGLEPEKSFQYQAGIRAKTQKFNMEVYVYQNHLKDLITNVSSTYDGQDSLDGFKVFRKENSNKALINGIEAELNFTPYTWLSTFANATYTVGDNITRDEPLSRIPPLFGRIGADARFRQFTWRVELLAATKQDQLSGGDKQDSRIPQGGTPGWTVLNTRVQYVYKNYRINTGIQNLFNKAYRVHGSGIDGVGRSFFVSFIAEFSTRRN